MCFIFRSWKPRKRRRHQLKELSMPSFSIVSHTFMHDVRTVPFSLQACLNPPSNPPPFLFLWLYSLASSIDLFDIYHITQLFLSFSWQPIFKRTTDFLRPRITLKSGRWICIQGQATNLPFLFLITRQGMRRDKQFICLPYPPILVSSSRSLTLNILYPSSHRRRLSFSQGPTDTVRALLHKSALPC